MSEEILNRPIAELSTRPLHFIWIADCSRSMNINGKMEQLNDAIRSSIPAMRDVAADNPHAKVYVRAVKFSSGAQWHVAEPTEIESFQWNDLQADGLTAMGEALKLVAQEMTVEKMPKRGLPPVLVLITDGMPTDEFDEGLNALLSIPWGKKAVKIAIGIGNDLEMNVLQKFIDDKERTPLKATNAEQLVHFIKWASTEVLKSASQPQSVPMGDSSLNTNNGIPIVEPQPLATENTGDMTW